jgi:hypothetical protein
MIISWLYTHSYLSYSTVLRKVLHILRNRYTYYPQCANMRHVWHNTSLFY